MVRIPLLTPRTPTVSVIRLSGVIAAGGGRLAGQSLSDQGLATLVERAFTRGKPKAVALQVNSPGGSPVQSALIAARIRRLAARHDLPVYAFCEDVAASGGYWLAAAADRVYADANSIVGSIGVISAGFGLQELISRHGIERRVHTSGEEKSFLDPFRPEDPEDVRRLEHIQRQMHRSFIDYVKSRRGDRLSGEDLFTGAFWTGREALERGLVDGIGHLVPVMQDIYGEKVRFNVMTPRRPLLQRFGMPGVEAALRGAEDRLAWQRFGL